MKRGLIIVVLGLFLTSCDNETDYLVTITTSYGEMKAVLFDDTPLHKENFIKLIQEGRYDSTCNLHDTRGVCEQKVSYKRGIGCGKATRPGKPRQGI